MNGVATGVGDRAVILRASIFITGAAKGNLTVAVALEDRVFIRNRCPQDQGLNIKSEMG